MNRFVCFIFIVCSFVICHAFADTINLHWLNYDGTTYQDSTCTVSSDLIIPSTPPTRYGYTFTGWKLSNYIPIEYLESTGTQYIDTGYIGNLYTKISVTVSASVASSPEHSTIIARDITSKTHAISILLTLDSGPTRTNRFGNKSIEFPQNTCSINHRYTIEVDKDNMKLDGNIIGYFNTTTYFQTNGSLYVFNLNPTGAT